MLRQKRAAKGIIRILFAAILLLLLLPTLAEAQFGGTIGFGGETTNNVQKLDTTAPDNTLLPAFELSYGWQLSGASKVTFAGGYSPNIYTKNSPLSYNLTTVGATGSLYLSNLEAIAEEAGEAMHGGGSNFRESRYGSYHLFPIYDRMSDFDASSAAKPPQIEFGYTERRVTERHVSPRVVTASSQDVDDSLVEIAVGALYTLSGQLDSSEISTKGLSKKRIQELEDLRDSISDVLSTTADLLDSTGYSQSVAEIILPELKKLQAPFRALSPVLRSTLVNASLLDTAMKALTSARPESDYLATADTPAHSAAGPILADNPVAPNLPPSPAQPHQVVKVAKPSKEESLAPIITSVQSGTDLRDFGAGEVSILEDLEDSNSTTLATLLTLPISWSSHAATNFSTADSNLFGGVFEGSPNDYRSLALGAAIESYFSGVASLRGSYDFTKSAYPFDSVYSSSEHRFGMTPRIALGRTTVLFCDASIGFREYLNPLQVTTSQVVQYDSIGAKGHVFHKTKDSSVTKAAASKFTQFSYGIGLSQFVGERWVVGCLLASNHNPNLRAYVTTAQVQTVGKKGRAVRAAVQVADDEYTYDLSRYSVFSNARLPWDLDFGVDCSYEQRSYGSAVGPKGNPLPGGEGRTETGWFVNASLSRLFPFEYRIAGVFNSLTTEAKVEIASVSASQSLYSYQATVVGLTATLGF